MCTLLKVNPLQWDILHLISLQIFYHFYFPCVQLSENAHEAMNSILPILQKLISARMMYDILTCTRLHAFRQFALEFQTALLSSRSMTFRVSLISYHVQLVRFLIQIYLEQMQTQNEIENTRPLALH